MLCEKCGKNPATVMYTQIINGHKETIHICSECASEESIFNNFGSFFNFAPLRPQTNVVCPVCNMTLSEFARSAKAGCGNCYSVFRPYAKDLLKKIHHTSEHVKEENPKVNLKENKEARKPETETEKLKRLMSEAIEKENFEEAASLRDKIKALEKEGE